jgi:hypothetical protein
MISSNKQLWNQNGLHMAKLEKIYSILKKLKTPLEIIIPIRMDFG